MKWSEMSLAGKIFTIATTVVALGGFNFGCIWHASTMSTIAVCVVDGLAVALGIKLALE